MNNNSKILKYILIGFFILLTSSLSNYRIDLTENKRFTLNNSSILFLKKLNKQITIDIFLSGKLPHSYRKLSNETRELLKTFKSINNNFKINFINPFKNEMSRKNIIDEMISYGMRPDYITDTNNQNINQKTIFPWAIINDNNSSVLIPLTESTLGDSNEISIINGIQQLEYKFIDGIKRLDTKQRKKVAFITSHNTSSNLKVYDWIKNLQLYYEISVFDLKKHKRNPKKTFDNLTTFPLIIISNPKEKFSNTEKFLIDQYQVNGGSVLWLIDAVNINKEILFNNQGEFLAVKNDLDLDDYFFNYSLKINYQLIKDIYCSPIVIADGTDSNTKYLPFPWVYYPITKPVKSKINKSNIGSLWFRFVSPIDTLSSSVFKTHLAFSSKFNQIQNIPSFVDIKTAINPLNPKNYNHKSSSIAVLSEGNHKSLYKNRISPIPDIEKKDAGFSKLILISDGQFAENQTDYKNNAHELGYDKWTNNFYSNKKFLMNIVHYLTNSNDLLITGSKKIKIGLFDVAKVNKRSLAETILFLISPFLFLLILFILSNKARKYFS